MTDIDFDELDRAVNSLMQQGSGKSPVSTPEVAPESVSADPAVSSETAPAPQEAAPATPQDTPEIAPASAPEPPVEPPVDEAASVTAPELESEPAAPAQDIPAAPVTSTAPTIPATPASPPLATKRSSGRFMDIVAPASVAAAPKPRASHVGVALQPTMDVVPPTASAAPVAPVEEEFTAVSMTEPEELRASVPRLRLQPTVPEEELIPDDVTSDISMMSRMAGELEALEAQDLFGEEEEKAATPTEESTSSPAPAPLESPFVPGAVVDKRPLGNTPSTEATSEKADAQDEPIEPAPVPEPAPVQDLWGETEDDERLETEPLAPELDKDLMALESGASVSVEDIDDDEQIGANIDDTPEVASGSDPESEPKVPIDEAPVAAKNPVADSSTATSKPTATVVGGDIPQQYTADLDSEPEPAPVYHAASQVPELTHKEKKKSGWLSVVMIFLLFILGGAGGAAAWYFFL